VALGDADDVAATIGIRGGCCQTDLCAILNSGVMKIIAEFVAGILHAATCQPKITASVATAIPPITFASRITIDLDRGTPSEKLVLLSVSIQPGYLYFRPIDRAD
jgi:hypothetical protein